MARRPSRIPLVMRKLQIAWELVPDWRLCQLISNLHGNGQQDIFYTEEDELDSALDSFIKEWSKNNTSLQKE